MSQGIQALAISTVLAFGPIGLGGGMVAAESSRTRSAVEVQIVAGCQT